MSDKTKPEPTPFEKMRALAATVVSVPKAAIEKREAEWRKERASAKKKLPKQH
jgi:hypothetical protein